MISAEYADMNRGQLLAKIHELEEVSYVIVFTNIDWTSYTVLSLFFLFQILQTLSTILMSNVRPGVQ